VGHGRKEKSKPRPFETERVGHPEKLDQFLGVDVLEWYHLSVSSRQQKKYERVGHPPKGWATRPCPECGGWGGGWGEIILVLPQPPQGGWAATIGSLGDFGAESGPLGDLLQLLLGRYARIFQSLPSPVQPTFSSGPWGDPTLNSIFNPSDPRKWIMDDSLVSRTSLNGTGFCSTVERRALVVAGVGLGLIGTGTLFDVFGLPEVGVPLQETGKAAVIAGAGVAAVAALGRVVGVCH
jgi:hypothetical protein